MTRIGERARLLEFGFERPLLVERSDETLGPVEGDRVLVAVEACGVCYRDLIDRGGGFAFAALPITPGHEAAGRVLAVGAAVRDFRPGDRVGTMHRDACGACTRCLSGETSLCEGAAWVFGLLADGGYAHHLVAPESALFALPDTLAPGEAATLHCTFGTAWRDLVTLGRLQKGERVLVTGANGGVGSAGVQIAARLGAEVVAVLRDERHSDFVRSLGAHEVIVDAGAGLHHRSGPIDLALDTVGKPTFLSALRALRVGGRMVVVGNVVQQKVELNLGFLITKGLTVIGGNGATRRDMAAVIAAHGERPWRFTVETMPLANAEEAQQRVRKGGLQGRIALIPDAAPAAP